MKWMSIYNLLCNQTPFVLLINPWFLAATVTEPARWTEVQIVKEFTLFMSSISQGLTEETRDCRDWMSNGEKALVVVLSPGWWKWVQKACPTRPLHPDISWGLVKVATAKLTEAPSNTDVWKSIQKYQI